MAIKYLNKEGLQHFWSGIKKANVASATKLQTARKINGVAFDGTKDISIPIPEVPIGSIMPYAGYDAPSGWVFCNGQSLNEKDYPKLYAIIGNGYGGTTGADFKVPDLRGRVPVGKEASGADGIMGRVGGEKEHRLTLEEMPEHRHELWISFEGIQPTTRDWSIRQYKEYIGNYAKTEPAGKDRPHNNMQPYMILNYIIKAK